MARARRRAGLLRGTILHVMQEGVPMRAVEIRERVHREGLPVAASLFFRDLRKLVDGGAVLRVNVARGYMLASREQRVLLYCRGCGKVSEVACEEAFERLAAIAERHGFSASRRIVEASGLCRDCQPKEKPGR